LYWAMLIPSLGCLLLSSWFPSSFQYGICLAYLPFFFFNLAHNSYSFFLMVFSINACVFLLCFLLKNPLFYSIKRACGYEIICGFEGGFSKLDHMRCFLFCLWFVKRPFFSLLILFSLSLDV
jgi:hypothetical protein